MSVSEQKILEGYKNINDIELAFGTTDLLPTQEDIPEEYKFHTNSKWNKLFSDMFFSGLSDLQFTPKEGIDPEAAFKCVRAHMASWEPSHQDKESGVAYMMSVLFEDATWETKKD